MNKVILMDDEDKQRWYKSLQQYYSEKGKSESDIPRIIDKVFADVQTGWNHAPNDLDTRIKMKTGFQWKSHENLIPNRQTIEDIITKDEDDVELASGDLLSAMNKEEQKWYLDRIQTYAQDFDFNQSSDKPLLDQLMVEELIQRRIFYIQLKYPNKDYNKKLTDSLKRIAEIQIRLGITREQRSGLLDKIDGNVAQISVELDEKLANMPEQLKKEYEEELYYLNLKKQKPPINVLPPVEKIEALLKIDGKVTTNISSERSSEITETVAKEITEMQTEKPPKKELPEGIDVSR